MTKITFSQLIAGALFSLCLATVPARALSLQTYVSGKGADTGACATPATACRTFAFAIGQTAASGEIKVIDPANYGPVTITKAISIVAEGASAAGITLASGTAIIINAGASDAVSLRGLTLDGNGTAGFGIVLTSAGSLTIADCAVLHFQSTGIQLSPTGALKFLVSNTISTDHGPGSFQGHGLVVASNTTGALKGVVDRFTANDDADGIAIDALNGSVVALSILNSVMANNKQDGVLVAGQSATVTVRNSVASHNGYSGFNLNTGPTLRLADSMAAGNQFGIIFASGTGTVFSYGDNEINGNGTDVSGGTLTKIAKK